MSENSSSTEGWAELLAVQLQKREADYRALRIGSRHPDADEEQCRVLALKVTAFALLDVIAALRKLIPFRSDAGLAPLHDLVAGLHDLTIGGNPSSLQSASGGTGRDGVAKFYVKRHAVIAVLLLRETGLTDKAARESVASSLSAFGFKGRKGAPLSAKTLFKWVEDCRATEVWPDMKRYVQDWADDPECPLTEDQVLTWLKRVGGSTLMQSKI